MRKRMRPASRSPISSDSALKETRAPFTTARSDARAPSRARKPLSRMRITFSCPTASDTIMTTSIGSLYVGASGFSYATWKAGFYPPSLPAKDFLRHYAERLPSVELNSTFYNLPSEAAVETWADATPAGFRFAVKMNRRICQFGNLALATEFCERMKGLRESLGPIRVLVTRARDEGWLSLLLDSLDRSLSYAFEFRHPSWEGAA